MSGDSTLKHIVPHWTSGKQHHSRDSMHITLDAVLQKKLTAI